MVEASVYDLNAKTLYEHGGYPLAIGPKTKRPQHFSPSDGKYCDTLGWTHPRRPHDTSPQPGAGIGVRLGKQADGSYLIALDWDNDEAALVAMERFPSTALKEGARGVTMLYRSPVPIASRNFMVNGIPVMQVLADGRQTVLPPTIHPDTNRPYTWGSKFTLYNTHVNELPLLPANYTELIEEILRPLGYEPEPEQPQGNGHDAEGGNPFQELNNLALNNLALWVPGLDLYKLRRRPGRGATYEAVASWRPSNKGRPLEERDRNLQISRKGITDFGTGKGYSPIDLTMVAIGISRADAMGWLQDRLRPKDAPDVDFEALKANAEQTADSHSDKEDRPRDDGGADSKPKKYKFQLVDFDDLRPGMEMPYLVENMIPLRGLVMIWGKPKSLKSFFMLDMMLHVAKGWEFFGRAVKQGHVVYCAFEGGHGYDKRVEALRIEYELDGRTPFQVMKGAANLINDHRLLIQEIKEQIKNRWGDAVPAAFVLDTLNKSLHGSENKDIDMAAYMRAAEAIRDAFDCVVIIVHHCGWDETRPRGHSSQIGTIDAQLSALREGDVVVVTVEDMRDGPEGNRVAGRKKEVEVGTDVNGKPLTSLVIEHLNDDHAATGPKAASEKQRKWPASLKVFYAALVEATLGFGFDHKVPDGPVVKAVDVDHVSEVFSRTYVVKGKADSTPEQTQESRAVAFSRALEKAQRAGLIAALVRGTQQIVWTVSPFEGDGYGVFA